MILNRYIIKTVLFASLLLFFVVLALTYFINFLTELHDIGTGDYGVLQAALHVLLELPHAVYQFFPMLILLSGLFGLGLLASYQELMMMRVSGLAAYTIYKAVAFASLYFILFGLLIGEVLAPKGHYLADKYKSVAESSGQAIATITGIWVHEGNNFFHIEHVLNYQYLEGITRYEFNAKHQLLAAYYAAKMNYVKGHWQVQDVVKTVFQGQHTLHQQLSHTIWNIALRPQFLNVGLIEPDEMPLPVLAKYIKHLNKNHLEASQYQFNFWQRVLAPFTILIMLMSTIPFAFQAPRAFSMSLRLVLGVLAGFIFYILNGLLQQISIVFQVPPLLAALLPLLLFAMIGYFFMRRIA